MKIIEGDITEVKSGIIVHQVNTLGIMGGGLALQIKNKFPKAFTEYIKFLDEKKRVKILGLINIVDINNDLSICNLFGQSTINIGMKNTSYDAIDTGLKSLSDYIESNNIMKDVYFPYKMGSDLGGGNWNVVFEIIEQYFPNHTLVIYRKM